LPVAGDWASAMAGAMAGVLSGAMAGGCDIGRKVSHRPEPYFLARNFC
jgi:hypothetical protein